MRAFTDGWKEVTKEQILFIIIREEEYNDIDNGDAMMKKYLNMAA